MRMERVIIQLPSALKHKLDALRAQGYTAAGYIRNVLEQHFQNQVQTPGKKGGGERWHGKTEKTGACSAGQY